MKKLLKKEVYGSRVQCMGPIGRFVFTCFLIFFFFFLKSREMPKTQMQGRIISTQTHTKYRGTPTIQSFFFFSFKVLSFSSIILYLYNLNTKNISN